MIIYLFISLAVNVVLAVQCWRLAERARQIWKEALASREQWKQQGARDERRKVEAEERATPLYQRIRQQVIADMLNERQEVGLARQAGLLNDDRTLA